MSYKRQLFTGVNSVVNTGTSTSPPSSTSSPAKDLPEFNIAILGTLGVGKSGTHLASNLLHTRVHNTYIDECEYRSLTRMFKLRSVGLLNTHIKPTE